MAQTASENRQPHQTSARLGPAAHAAIAALYLALAIWLTWPAAAHLGTRYFTGGEQIFFFPTTPDAPQNIWNFWLAERSVAEGRSPLFTTLLYHPEGVQMILQTMNILAVLTALPVTAALGPTAAYNTTAILAVALTGYAGFLLARAFAPGLAGPLLAGALLTASPFHIAKLDAGQLNFVTLQWLVLFMLAWVALGRVERWWAPPVAALAFAAVLYTDWYWALTAALFGATWAALSLVGAARPWALVGRYAAFAVLAGLAALPLALALRAAPAGEGGVSEQWAVYTQGYSADALGLLFPAARHPLWAAPVERFLVAVAPFGVTEGSYTAAGWALVGLGALGALWYGRRHWRLLVVAGVAWLLAVGPRLFVLGHDTGIPMPYALLQAVPLLETARRPNLFGVVTIAVAAVFAALAVAGLRERLPRRRYALALGALAAVALVELWPPARVANALDRPEVFTRIAAEPGVVVDLPIEGDTNSRTLINQMAHGQPILRGYVARPPRYVTLAYSPLVAELAHMRPSREDDIIALGPEALAAMQCYYRLRHVVLDKTLLTGSEQRFLDGAVARLGGGEARPWFEDERFRAYRLPIDEDSCAPFVFLGEGWAEPEGDGERRWRWSGADAELWVVNPAAEARTLNLTLSVVAREEGQPLAVWRGEEQVASFVMGTARRRYSVALALAPGMHQVRLTTPVATEGGTGRRLGASVLGVEVR